MYSRAGSAPSLIVVAFQGSVCSVNRSRSRGTVRQRSVTGECVAVPLEGPELFVQGQDGGAAEADVVLEGYLCVVDLAGAGFAA